MERRYVSYLDEEGRLAESCPVKLDKELLIKILKTMLLTRAVDARMLILQRQGKITFAMSSLGEEAAAVATAAALEEKDWIYPQYREAGALFWRGFAVSDYIHQMFGNAKDLTLGRQMPNHFGSRQHRVVTVSSPIGTKIPHAAGAAYAMRLQKELNCVLCYFGEGSTSEGDFHAGLNFAAVRKAPVIYLCRNNGYAISTATHSQFASKGIAVKAEGYGMASCQVDGNDPFALYEAVREARTRAVTGEGPTLIEAVTYRLGAHSTSDDPSRYRKEEERKIWEKRCPVKRLSNYLIDKNLWGKEEEAFYLKELENRLSSAVEEAQKSAPPSRESLIQDVYFQVPLSLKEQLEELSDDG